MSEPKFTPGPWVAKCERLHDGNPYAEITPDGDSSFRNSRYLNVSGCIDKHDAHLIAAAPELYEALDQLLDDMGENGLSVCQAAKEQARAALAKARGESHD